MKNEDLKSMIIISIVISIIEQFGQFSLKNSKSIFDMFYINGIVFYILVAILFHYIYNNYNVNKVNIIWACISIVLAVILGAIFENESITLNKIIAVFFSIVAIYFAQ
jgi:multidrug transporter EmrE-like cation transporter